MSASVIAVVALLGATVLLGAAWTRRSAPEPIAAVAKAPRIIVRPFENLGAPEDAYFAAGITEELIGRLANVRGLAVISRTTSVGYDRKGRTIPQIGADLGVDFVLEGTVRPEREKGKTQPGSRQPRELIHVANDTPIWSERYNQPVADIFKIQSDLADKVVKAMGVELVPREKTALEAAFTNDADAYDLYLKGLEFVNAGQTHRNLEAAARAFGRPSSAIPVSPRRSTSWAEPLHVLHAPTTGAAGRCHAPRRPSTSGRSGPGPSGYPRRSRLLRVLV